jgi:hypothetical protein
MAAMARPRLSSTLLVALAAASLGAPCGAPPPFSITKPREAQILPDAALPVVTQVGRAYDPASVVIELDGVDLLAALGLVPPFTDASGVIAIGGEPVTIQNFDFDTTLPGSYKPSFEIVGLPAGDHQIDLSGVLLASGAPKTRARHFAQVDGFTPDASELAAAALSRPVAADGGRHVLASVGGDPAGAAVPLSDGGTLREGFVSAALRLR